MQASIRQNERLSLQEMPSGTSPIQTNQVQPTAGIQTPLPPGSCSYSKAVLQCPAGRQVSDGLHTASCSWLPGTVFLSAKQETNHCLLFFFFPQLTKKKASWINIEKPTLPSSCNKTMEPCIVPIVPSSHNMNHTV